MVTDEQVGASRVKNNAAFMNFLNVSSLCNLATVFKDKETGWVGHGDPTEVAIQTFSSRFGWARGFLTKGSSDGTEGAKTGDAAWLQISE